MSVGPNPSKLEIDSALGVVMTDLHMVMLRVVQLKFWLDGVPDADLTTLGYSSTDISNMRSAVADGNQIAGIFDGAATLAVAKDFRTFIRRVWGFGYQNWN